MVGNAKGGAELGLGAGPALTRALILETARGESLFERPLLLGTPDAEALFLFPPTVLDDRFLFLAPRLEALLELLFLREELGLEVLLLLRAPLREAAALFQQQLLGPRRDALLLSPLLRTRLVLHHHGALREQLLDPALLVDAPRGKLLLLDDRALLDTLLERAPLRLDPPVLVGLPLRGDAVGGDAPLLDPRVQPVLFLFLALLHAEHETLFLREAALFQSREDTPFLIVAPLREALLFLDAAPLHQLIHLGADLLRAPLCVEQPLGDALFLVEPQLRECLLGLEPLLLQAARERRLRVAAAGREIDRELHLRVGRGGLEARLFLAGPNGVALDEGGFARLEVLHLACELLLEDSALALLGGLALFVATAVVLGDARCATCGGALVLLELRPQLLDTRVLARELAAHGLE